jgi:hypothetical protein
VEGFDTRKVDLVLSAFTDQADLSVIIATAVLHGKDDVAEYMRRYLLGSVVYEWRWESVQPVAIGGVGVLWAEGTEIRSTPAGTRELPYRVTLVARFEENGWRIAHFHGSSARPSGT